MAVNEAPNRPLRLIFVAPSGPEPIGGVSALYGFANALARRGHEVHLVHLEMWGRRVRSMDDLARYHFDASITHYLPGADPDSLPDGDLVFGTGAPPRLGLPVLVLQGFEMLHEHLERSALRTPSLKLCVASWLRGVGVRYGVAPEQIHLVPMGIDHDRYRITVPLEDRSPQVSILHSTHAAKGWDVGLLALEEVHRRQPDVRVVAFGTVAPDPLPPWIDFHRNPPPASLVGDIYNRSQVFVQSSDYEGFGFTAVEAMACGAALVTTDNGGTDDYASHDDTALVVAPRDVDGLATGVLALLDDPQRRLRIARSGAARARRFDWDLGAEIMEAHLRQYLADPAAYLVEPGPEVATAPLLGPRPTRS
jgi:glycosyltransferase involved in cell wall biosynthesis